MVLFENHLFAVPPPYQKLRSDALAGHGYAHRVRRSSSGGGSSTAAQFATSVKKATGRNIGNFISNIITTLSPDSATSTTDPMSDKAAQQPHWRRLRIISRTSSRHTSTSARSTQSTQSPSPSPSGPPRQQWGEDVQETPMGVTPRPPPSARASAPAELGKGAPPGSWKLHKSSVEQINETPYGSDAMLPAPFEPSNSTAPFEPAPSSMVAIYRNHDHALPSNSTAIPARSFEPTRSQDPALDPAHSLNRRLSGEEVCGDVFNILVSHLVGGDCSTYWRSERCD